MTDSRKALGDCAHQLAERILAAIPVENKKIDSNLLETLKLWLDLQDCMMEVMVGRMVCED